jgi:archaemetzincin
MHSILLPVALVLMSSASGSLGVDTRPVVALQPFGALRAGVVATVKSGIERRYNVSVVVLPERPLPDTAYYRPRHRYRAERLLDTLDAVGDSAGGTYAKIVGLTASDISTTVDEHEDFGIFGLGDLGGAPCVVSTFRLGRGGASEALFSERVVKAVNHELGHTFGVDHCPQTGCLMSDAAGTMRRVDSGTGELCAVCAQRLEGLVRIEPIER